MAIIPENLLIEVCVDSVPSAIAAIKGGADRLEVCGNLGIGGGTTPSFGLLKSIQNSVDVPLMVMIRPRVGDFLYSKAELMVMLDDIRAFKDLGNIRGFVVGVLTKDGRVDVECMKMMVDEILPLEVCFHRAFDMTRDAKEALRDIADIGGISRILTSGHKSKAPDGLPILEELFMLRKELIEDVAWGLTIMPGSGINSQSLPKVLEALLPLGLREIHMSGGKWFPGDMLFHREGMGMGIGSESEWGVWRTQEEEVGKARHCADAIWNEYACALMEKE
ncbi:copper homeostasis CutC domain-containing protein [Crassisporium funariophilum]|nr:copper homeostasis CutC domain-containing protein [Crassisporium funariophilum]